jgi:hypothetical protein
MVGGLMQVYGQVHPTKKSTRSVTRFPYFFYSEQAETLKGYGLIATQSRHTTHPPTPTAKR